MNRKLYAIIVAGGEGRRFGSKVPKQFLELNQKPVIVHTIDKFLALKESPEIVIVLPDSYKSWWREWCFRNGYDFKHQLVSGGITRFHSIKNALQRVTEPSIVAVHDGVRSLVTTEHLQTLYQLAQGCDALVPVIKPVDSMRVVDKSGGSRAVDREAYLMVQTPQLFKSEVLIEGYNLPYSPSFTDDASVVEALGVEITTTLGERENFKITKREDFELARAILALRSL